MIVYDDLQPGGRVKSPDRGVNLVANGNDRHKMLVSYRAAICGVLNFRLKRHF